MTRSYQVVAFPFIPVAGEVFGQSPVIDVIAGCFVQSTYDSVGKPYQIFRFMGQALAKRKQ